jgi:hypothetical protein
METQNSKTVELRPLTEPEIVSLEQALGKPIDRKYLVDRVSRSIRDVVRLSALPTPREYRDGLVQMVEEGRRWLQLIEQCPDTTLFSHAAELAKLKTTVARFCDKVDSTAKRISANIKPGHPNTPFALKALADNMLGIAKRAKVVPSTPNRTMLTFGQWRDAPFFHFVGRAIAIGEDVIRSSPLTETQKKAALAILAIQSPTALIKFLEKIRGRTSDYHDSPYGLVERIRRPKKHSVRRQKLGVRRQKISDFPQ